MTVEESTLTKADIVEQVYNRIGFSKREALDFVEMVFLVVKDTLCEGENVKILGFGNFVVRDKKSRKGRNPQTGEPITIPARRVLTFKPSPLLKNLINEEN